MALPIYKQVHLKSDQKEQIFEQLKLHNFGDVPYLFILTHLENQQLALQGLEECIAELDLATWPYPLYVISNILGHKGRLEVLQDIQQCPQFFNKKVKPLHVKEQQLMQKLLLKQKNIKNLRKSEYQPVLNRYAKAHKAVFKASIEANYLENLLQKLTKSRKD